MNRPLIAQASVTVAAPPATVWDALVNPALIKQYFFGTTVISDWQEGSPIVWKGEWQGASYEDKGQLLRIEPERLLQYSHFSPLSNLADVPDNYHTITIELAGQGAETLVTLSQDNNATEADREHSRANWEMVLAGLKRLLETQRPG